jgi:thiol-disulfide isomerase/thioredoxin
MISSAAELSNARRRSALAHVAGLLFAIAVALSVAACQRAPQCDPKEKVNLDFKVKDLDGREVNLASYRGRPLLLNFWATWCGPCKEEIPALVALADQYKSRVAILGISVDDTPADLKKFSDANKVNYPLLVGLGHDELLEAYDAQVGVPVSWVVAANGCPVAKHPGGATKDWFAQQMKAAL